MDLACRNATEEPTEANLVRLLDLWSADWKHRGRTRAVGPGAYERYATLGLFGHGGVVGAAVNGFLKSRFPWHLHRHYAGGRVWIEDDEGDSTAWLADKKGGRELRGRWLDMHDEPVSFDARRYHMVVPTRRQHGGAGRSPFADSRADCGLPTSCRRATYEPPTSSLRAADEQPTSNIEQSR
ncbi:unnamed protein product [Symbiodinium sp. CCMP2592]|nr:unnamed protein product [Symbiodinium sp. CCMP2592]